jgi:hypothetical protein
MQTKVRRVPLLFCSFRDSLSGAAFLRSSFLAGSLLLTAAFIAGPAITAQTLNRITQNVDVSRVQPLPDHHPLWASAANSNGLAPADLPLNQLTLVLSRSPQQEQAFEQFLAGQQNPASPDFHHWLTPAEVGERFGLSGQDVATITAWLQSQGLQVNWVSPSRVFIGFAGTAANVGRAFQTEMRYYNVNGEQKLSVNSDPMVPAALLPAIKGIRGLYTIDEHPLYQARAMQSVSPLETANSGNHYLAPADFATIYDLPASLTGAGITIGIVDRSRTNFADFSNFRSLTGSSFPNPTEIVPTAFGGLDPGPAYTAPPGGTTTFGEQGEATLDVLRAGSVAPGASLLLVVATSASGGIDVDTQYLVQTTPVPAQVMTISFGACESSAGAAGVTFWDTLFQQAVAEGISVFVSSGDAGASGCDTHGSAPPASPLANSPNYICSSSYATCVGGTEFNEGGNPSQYWTSSNGSGLKSVFGYIPEGAWNESTASNVAASGGGVSSVIPTPSWQTGAGVPAAQAGRYTPDISFSSSGHDGYFGCFAAGGAGCVVSNGGYSFEYFYGTSAAAPDMAGIAALLDQELGAPQGNLNPQIYSMAATAPAAFHDVTVATSGVVTCDINTASMCNNSIALLSGGGAQPGYLVGTGYDEVTGLGSLDVAVFLNNFSPPITTPTVALQLYPSSSITTAQSLIVTVTVSGATTLTPTGSVTLSSGSYSATATSLSNGYASFTIAAGALAAGSDTLTASYTPDASSSARYNAASGSTNVTVTAVPLIVPTIWVGASATLSTAQQVQVSISVSGGAGNTVPTGTVTLTSGAYTSAPANVAGGMAAITIPALTLAAGTDTLTVVYTPDTASSSVYKSASGTATITETGTKITPWVGVGPSPSSITTAQALSVGVVVSIGDSSYLVPTGSVILTSGSYTSAATSLVGSGATIIVPAGSLAIGTDTLAAVYMPDSSSSAVYNTATGSSTVTVTTAPPTFTVAGTAVTITAGATTGNTSTITITPANGFTGSVTLSAAVATSPTGAVNPPTFTFTTNPVSIASATAATTTLTIATTASQTTSCVAVNQAPTGLPWYAKGGAVLACVLLFGIAPRRRKGRTMLGALMLLIAFAGGVMACGGGGNSSNCSPTTTPGTTAGSYTITVTGTSGSMTATNTIALTVN